MASRLTTLRYHLKMSLRQLTQAVHQQPMMIGIDPVAIQWQHIHQLLFLLRQIDSELGRATTENEVLRAWMQSLDGRVYRSALVHLN